MSTLTISIIALVAFVVGAVLLFNLWQAKGGRRRKDIDDDLPRGFDAPGSRTGRGVGGGRPDSQGRVDGRRRQPGADDNDWTRQRREPTLLAEDEAVPSVAHTRTGHESHGQSAPSGYDQPAEYAEFARTAPDDPGRGLSPEARRNPQQDRRSPHEDRLPDPLDDLGPPEFEAPHLDPLRLDPSVPEPVRSGTRRVEHGVGSQGAGSQASGSHASGSPAAAAFPPDSGSQAGVDRGALEAPEDGGAAADGPGRAGAAAADVDVAVMLVPRTPVNAERLIALTSSLRHVGCKAVRIEIDGGKGTWVPLQSGSMVSRLRCSVLLANRQGPLNAVELSDFSAAVEALAGQVGARFTAPDMNQVMRRARDLDAVAARLDTQVDLGVEASAPVSAQKLASIARKLELVDRGGGRFASFAESGELLYTLAAGESADLLAFVLDVPRTSQEQEPWRRMVACASSCAKLVGGRVIDSTGRGMSVGMIDSVGVQIDRRYRELADAGLRAGSQAALRVFN